VVEQLSEAQLGITVQLVQARSWPVVQLALSCSPAPQVLQTTHAVPFQ
jgi:hypothetical protein